MKEATTSTHPQSSQQDDALTPEASAGPDWSQLVFAPRPRTELPDEIPSWMERVLSILMRFFLMKP